MPALAWLLFLSLPEPAVFGRADQPAPRHPLAG
jgi:hypothetical protein